MAKMTCFEVLGISSSATPDEVNQAWRAAMSEHHPDRGGDPEKLQAARAAYQEARVKAAVCPTCEGAKKISITKGWNKVTVCCSSCRGSGVRS